MVILGILELQDVVDLQIKPAPFNLLLALASHELPLDDFAEQLLGEFLCLTGSSSARAGVLHAADGEVCEIRPLEEIVDDPHFLRITESLARVNCHCIVDITILSPFPE